MKTVCFGEIMLRLNPAGYTRFIQTDTFGATYGGGEANVAVSLANYGIDASYVTKLPSHEIGQSAVNSLRRYGVDTSDELYKTHHRGYATNKDIIERLVAENNNGWEK